MTTSVVSGRVDARVLQKADLVLRKAGLTPTDVIQRVWASMAATGEIPSAILAPVDDRHAGDALARLEGFLDSLPAPDPAYAGMDDDDILALRTADDA